MKAFKSFLKNWKTTLAGLIGIGAVVVPIVAPEHSATMAKIATAAAAVGLIAARDADKSSEQSGADSGQRSIPLR